MSNQITVSEISAKGIVLEKNIENFTTSTTSVSVEETVATLEFTEESTKSTPVTPTASPRKAIAKANGATSDGANQHRTLPIFSNPLLANATQANSVPVKPKAGRVKSSGGKAISVLRINAPKVDGYVVVMRRLDQDLVNATSMFNAAYPAISEKMNSKENQFIMRKYQGHMEKSGALSGVWITVAQVEPFFFVLTAKELAKEYGIDQFMRPLLEAPIAKIASLSEGEEVIEKVVVTEVTTVQTTTTADSEIEDLEAVALGKRKMTDDSEGLTAEDVAGMKRRIEELENQVSRDKKKLRGLVTVAVGLAAATVIPQVLPYFS
ncbi:hypothetical protein BCR41DRAFT_200457 [Lobosporangium transversale]|uniref:HTH APSES-type domain-containing protein n=1 Tax=Lobosporangium transversale TaxID=64571 RepID=A0A1Y2GB00_9FUNG|nr:hypothetical protein BCR41DRAFT_200457 [Lobosporangium transversale]ORZ04192.1 hypothetical protein BCR41DRAFT_200457 [Lobosporangium transversale]|eukprot:XP_021876406.1 hypothetical protein BCR41DRAFT_200457 [Lobosporangium transversale]